MNGNTLMIESDIKIRLGEIQGKVFTMLQERQSELDKIIEDAINKFDFEGLVTAHVHSKITSGLYDAFEEIDLKEDIKRRIWTKIEAEMKDNLDKQS